MIGHRCDVQPVLSVRTVHPDDSNYLSHAVHKMPSVNAFELLIEYEGNTGRYLSARMAKP